MIQDWKPENIKQGRAISWRRVQLTYAPANKMSALGTIIKKGEVALHIATDRQTGNDFWLTLDEIQRFINGKPTKFVALRSSHNLSSSAVYGGAFVKPIDDDAEIDSIIEMAVVMKR
jgi:hypothetical protein